MLDTGLDIAWVEAGTESARDRGYSAACCMQVGQGRQRDRVETIVGAKVAFRPVNGAGGAEKGNGKWREASRPTKKVDEGIQPKVAGERDSVVQVGGGYLDSDGTPVGGPENVLRKSEGRALWESK